MTFFLRIFVFQLSYKYYSLNIFFDITNIELLKFYMYMKWIRLMIIRIRHVVWNYSLVYPLFSSVMHSLSIGFCLRLVRLTFYRRCFFIFIHFKPYIFMCSLFIGIMRFFDLDIIKENTFDIDLSRVVDCKSVDQSPF